MMPGSIHGTHAAIETNAVALVHTQAALVLKALRVQPLTARQTRLLRVILNRFYGKGYCHARQETLAAEMDCAKATVQADLAELADRGFIRITKREGTSNFTELVPGMAEALHVLQAEAESNRINWEHAAELKAAFQERLPVVFPTQRPKGTPYPMESSTPHKHVTPLDVSEITNTSSCTPTRKEEPDDARDLVKKLMDEGVSPSQAWKLARNFDTARIERNLAFGAHAGKRNPGGYLAEAIREDYAATAKPAHRNAPSFKRGKNVRVFDPLAGFNDPFAPDEPEEVPETPTESTSAPVSAVETRESADALLDALTDAEKAALRTRAVAELDRENAWMGASWKRAGAAFEGMVRGRMLKFARNDYRSVASGAAHDDPGYRNDDPMTIFPPEIVTNKNLYTASLYSPPDGGCDDHDDDLRGLNASRFRSDHDRLIPRGGGLQRLTFAPLISSA